jgi:hypothetical protein
MLNLLASERNTEDASMPQDEEALFGHLGGRESGLKLKEEKMEDYSVNNERKRILDDLVSNTGTSRRNGGMTLKIPIKPKYKKVAKERIDPFAGQHNLND